MPKTSAATEILRSDLQESILTKQKVMDQLLPQIARAAEWMVEALKNDNKVIFFGNGGSAADAQHLAAELVGRFAKERKGLPSMALTTDSSILTAIGNDFTFDYVFARQMEALGKSGDVAVGITTSGNSPNVVAAIELARKMGLKTIGLTGGTGGKLKDAAELAIVIPSNSTPRIQESHIALGHAICHVIDEELA